ncbi:hypothetical protein PIB30_024825 [Stylosanthes scabra]|uniref:Uncharacterized protein n=1 Tax=Stylosanthes scabra TaxID=79078 RepID=A0ABU6YAG3_9FABA|nr:hypothetical protein [Stylosanthes scabra]
MCVGFGTFSHVYHLSSEDVQMTKILHSQIGVFSSDTDPPYPRNTLVNRNHHTEAAVQSDAGKIMNEYAEELEAKPVSGVYGISPFGMLLY